MRSRRTEASLSARPHVLDQRGLGLEPGVHALGLAGPVRDGRIFVPRGERDLPRPLIVLLHGAGGDASSMLRMIGKTPAAHQCVLLVPDSRRHTWDFLVDGFGPDVSFLDQALEYIFDRCAIDSSRIALGGFSDGASYALTLGLANGSLFTHVMAFSPGFMRSPRQDGMPRVFVSHGTEDQVLPLQLCSARIVPELQGTGYDVQYEEFAGPHTVPDDILTHAMEWFLGTKQFRS